MPERSSNPIGKSTDPDAWNISAKTVYGWQLLRRRCELRRRDLGSEGEGEEVRTGKIYNAGEALSAYLPLERLALVFERLGLAPCQSES